MNTAPDPRREKEIFEQAVELTSLEERQRFLEQACGADAGLLAHVQGLLQAFDQAEAFLTQGTDASPPNAVMPNGKPAPTVRGEERSASPSEEVGTRVGRYKLLQKIGEGGCGVVYMAEQVEPVRRRVALKVVKLGMDTRQVIARFEAERQALAVMDHPNIARVLDAGATETGRPYFVMELVRGVRITQFCDERQLPLSERLGLFVQVCQAIQHAHQKGIIHRDLKPSNILVTLNDGVPVPKVIDFGIAKATQGNLTDKTLFTMFEQFIGTPAYMSPEQAEVRGVDIDTRSDIYSLGVVLYELLTGQTPFDSKALLQRGIEELILTLRQVEPPRPSTRLSTLTPADLRTVALSQRCEVPKLVSGLRGDLDWIVMKCLEKDRSRRYDTANGLAADIQRHLAYEPVVARPPSAVYRVRKLIRRNTLAFAAGALVFLVLTLGVAAVMLVQLRANQDYRRRLYVSEVNRAGLAWQAAQTAQMHTLLERCPTSLRGWEWTFLHQQLDRWERKALVTTTNLGGIAFSADGDLMVVAADGKIQVCATPSGQLLRHVPLQNRGEHASFALAPRGDFLAVAEDGTITIWNVRTGERVAGMTHAAVRVLTWCNDGLHLAAVGEDATLRLWEAKTGTEERRFSVSPRVLALAFAPDDKTLAVGTHDRDIQLLDPATGEVQRTLRTHGPYFFRLAFSPDGRKLAAANGTAGGFRRDHRVWSLDDGGSLDLNTGAEASSFSFSADGQKLIVGDATGMVQVWDLGRRTEVERFSVHEKAVSSVRWLSDDRMITACSDGISLWQARRPGVMSLKGYGNSLRTLAFSPDNRWLAAAGVGQALFVWDTVGGQLAGAYREHTDGASAVAFSREGHAASAGEMVRVWDPRSLGTKWATSLTPASEAYWVAFSPDGRCLYVPSKEDTLTVLDAATGARLNSISGLENVLDGIAVSPDGRLIALCQKVKLSVRRAEDLQELWSVAALPERCATFSPDGKWIATGDQDGAVSLWEVASAGRVRRALRGHAASVSGVSFHPDGTRLVSCSFDGRIKIWDWREGVELLTLPAPGGGQLWHAVFSPDGKTIAAAGGDGVVTLWRVE